MIYELDPVDVIEVAAVGEPGKRRFFLLASGQGRTLTLACEKTQVQALIVRLHQMMEAQGVDTGGRAPSSAALAPGEPEWQVGETGVTSGNSPGRPAVGPLLAEPPAGGRVLAAGGGRAHRGPAPMPALRPAHGPRRPPLPGLQRCPADLLSAGCRTGGRRSDSWRTCPRWSCWASCGVPRTTPSWPGCSRIHPTG
ncbi:MAG: DUF3090 family protein [Chloroflexi bacterium]|nr:MAG: DUF3090 family protein [Chloroflexota bacterium]